MFNLRSNISINSKIGAIYFNYLASCEILTSIDNMTDTATVRFPKKVEWKDKPLSSLIRKGDPISIELGYGDELHKVFDGFIRKVGLGIPLELDCEDDMYQLKLEKVAPKIYPTLTLRQLLTDYCPIGFECPDVNLGQFKIEGETTLARVLDFIRTEYMLSMFIRDGKLFAVLPSTLIGKEKGWNTILLCNEPGNDKQNVITDDIEYIQADDIKVQIIAKNVLKDNTKIEWKEPQNADDKQYEVKTYFCESATSVDDLKKFAKEKLSTVKEDMIKGTVMVFGEPFVQKGDGVKILNPSDKDIDGKEFIARGVNYVFNNSGKGYNQVITLGYRIN